MLASCRGESNQRERATTNRPATPPRNPGSDSLHRSASSRTGSDVHDLITHLPDCSIHYRGITLDLGDPASRTGNGFRETPREHGAASIDRAGASFAVLTERRASFDLWLDEPVSEPRLLLRAVGRSATSVTLQVDDRRIGTQKLSRDEITEVDFPRFGPTLPAGHHTIQLTFRGRATQPATPWAEIDWIHVGSDSELERPFAATTLRDVVADREIDNIPRRSVVLRAGSTVRCPLRILSGTRLVGSVGFWGTGRGSAELRIVEDGQPATVLREQKVVGGQGAQWTPIEVDLTPFADRVVGLELSARRAARGGRLVFGEPRIVRSTVSSDSIPRTRLAVVVVAAGLDRRRIPPWGAIEDLAVLGSMQRQAMAFYQYRAATTFPAGNMATLLTGLPPRVHGVVHTASRFLVDTQAVQQTIKQASGRTAFFTGVPTTFAAFGFDQGWDEYQTYSPVRDVSSEAPILDAAAWLARELDHDDESPRFVLVHTRGAHPPWDLTKDDVALLPPVDYSGALDPRRGGVTLGRLRRQAKRGQGRLLETDRQRMDAMMHAVLAEQSSALGELIDTLRRRDRWDDTLFIFLGDVASAEPPAIPFDPMGSLREDELLVPLLVKFPAMHAAGRSIQTPATSIDLAPTILSALGLEIPERLTGTDLYSLAAGREPLLGRALVATLGSSYSTRVGPWILRGDLGQRPWLCRADVDPACVDNQFERMPLTAHTLWTWTRDALDRMNEAAPAQRRDPATIDPETAAALAVWGDLE